MESKPESVHMPAEVMKWSTTGSSGEWWENRAKAQTLRARQGGKSPSSLLPGPDPYGEIMLVF